MFSSSILDVAIGLVFVFLVTSLIASALTEALASIFKMRSKTLLAGVKALVSDANTTGLAQALYNHALINPRDTGPTSGKDQPLDTMKNQPAYIDPKHFANAFIDVAELALAPGQSIAQLKTQIGNNTLLAEQTKEMLNGMLDRTNGRLDLLREELASWFDNAMDRVSGAYKRWSQLISFAVAFAVAVILNLDVIAVAQTLWARPMLAQTIATQAADLNDAQKALRELDSLHLPIGWNLSRPAQNDQKDAATTDRKNVAGDAAEESVPRGSIWLMRITSWLIAAMAALFGAPFWYDLLQSFVRLKGSGPSPAEKKADAAAAH